MRNLAKICGLGKSTMNDWFKKYGIPKKEKTNEGLYFHKTSGKLKRYISGRYFHPQLEPHKGVYGRTRRFEHVLIMENYLAENPELIWTKYGVSESCLLEGRYLDINCHVHHVNYDPLDNDIEDLWLYENSAEHSKAEKTIIECFSGLFKLGQIGFNNGEYYLNKNFDYRTSGISKMEYILIPIPFDPNDIYWEGGWHYKRYDRLDGNIWIRISDDYGNPAAMRNDGYMLKHRYIAERVLARNPEKSRKYLIDGKYLKSEYIVHHINIDPSDNRLKNLWLCESKSEHLELLHHEQ